MNWSLMIESIPALLYGALVTVQLLVLTLLFGGLLALPLGIVAANGRKAFRLPVMGYITFFRGTPLLVQIFLVYYGLAQFPFIRASFLWPYLREGFWYVALALILCVGAYVGEVLRGALRAVPRGELEAARAFGMKRLMVLRRVWLPRALELVKPTLVGETVLLLKATALASTVAVTDLLGAANLVRAQTLRVYEPLLAVAVIYLVLAFVIEHGFSRWGKVPQRQA